MKVRRLNALHLAYPFVKIASSSMRLEIAILALACLSLSARVPPPVKHVVGWRQTNLAKQLLQSSQMELLQSPLESNIA
jgi:hypothetical protein